jgi:hypothetical protein
MRPVDIGVEGVDSARFVDHHRRPQWRSVDVAEEGRAASVRGPTGRGQRRRVQGPKRVERRGGHVVHARCGAHPHPTCRTAGYLTAGEAEVKELLTSGKSMLADCEALERLLSCHAPIVPEGCDAPASRPPDHVTSGGFRHARGRDPPEVRSVARRVGPRGLPAVARLASEQRRELLGGQGMGEQEALRPVAVERA